MTVNVSTCGSPEWATIRPPSSEYQESEATVLTDELGLGRAAGREHADDEDVPVEPGAGGSWRSVDGDRSRSALASRERVAMPIRSSPPGPVGRLDVGECCIGKASQKQAICALPKD